jgi:hypothetical protein
MRPEKTLGFRDGWGQTTAPQPLDGRDLDDRMAATQAMHFQLAKPFSKPSGIQTDT